MMDESWVVLLLRHLGEVTSLTIAHRYLPVLALVILVMRLNLEHGPTVDPP